MNQNRLDRQNCNKAKCKTCIFGPTPVHLSNERVAEIHSYLATFTASHICHTTNLTCYGALEYQAKILYAIGVTDNPTVDRLLITANEVLNQNTNE